MTWTKLGDTFAEEFEDFGPEVMALHVAALCYCNRLLTDGKIPVRKSRTLFPLEDPDLAIKTLIDAGYWVETPTGYEIVDFFTDQRSAETVLSEREAARIRQANWRAAKAGNKSSTTSPSNGSQDRNGVTNGVSNAYPAPPRPAPKEGVGVGGPAGSPGGSPSAPPGDVKTRPLPGYPGWSAKKVGQLDMSSTPAGVAWMGWERRLEEQYSDLTWTVDGCDFKILVDPATDEGEEHLVIGYIRASVQVFANGGDLDLDDLEFFKALVGAIDRRLPSDSLAEMYEPMKTDDWCVEVKIPDAKAGEWIDRIYDASLDPKVRERLQEWIKQVEADEAAEQSAETQGCSVPGCLMTLHANGLCGRHYEEAS